MLRSVGGTSAWKCGVPDGTDGEKTWIWGPWLSPELMKEVDAVEERGDPP